ncbi:CHAD domain protein (plasmid) [Caballeronia sp. SBC1]|uniref:CHAD domain-containing protein n=1 Tax=unclassified Caballeronia TaxID=2646786 RepID=UPI0013E1287A|nr:MULTISPECIES: CHAD domain-containing protein [unclassified Caballeronia]QIE25802.1 CHAD domain protein [Caballeronia sp. SBC2]QIN64885.1 CHAD domain protein [Caballeronia sp. SBC1]
MLALIPDELNPWKDNTLPKSISTDTSTAAAFVLLATQTSTEAIRRAHALHDRSEPEALHKLRVALRRLRSLWWAYEPLLDKKDAKRKRSEFKYLADAAGRTRDWDVLRDILIVNQPKQLSQRRLLVAVEEHRTNALSFSLRTIRSAGVEEILQGALTSAAHQLDSRSVVPALSEFAEERVVVAEKALKRRVSQATEPEHLGYAALHEVRIAGKKLRYLLEFFSPVLARSHQSTIERLTSVQNELGKLNDLVTSETLLREYSFQLGERDEVKEAVRYLEDQKRLHMCAAHEILRASS